MSDLAFGIGITVLGMGIVFGVLALLWGFLTLALRLDRRIGGRGAGPAGASPGPSSPGGEPSLESGPAPAADGAPAAPVVRLAGAPDDLDPRLVAAIGVVVLRHAEMRRRQAAPAMRAYWPGSLLFASRWVASGRARQTRSWTRRAR